MKEKITKIILVSLGIFFIAFGIFAMDYGIYRGKPGWIFWLCYIGMVVIGFGIITKNGYLILSQLNILAIPLFFWNVDFIHFIITGKDLWGITNYFFGEMLWPARLISFEHLFLVPLSLLALYLIKINKKGAWKLSLVQLVLFFILTQLFTNPDYNVNYAFSSIFPPDSGGAGYVWRWFGYTFTFIILTNFLITKIPGLKPEKLKK